MKYIIAANDEVIIFSDSICHKDVADAMGIPVKSAGFFYVSDRQPLCYGKSESLGIGSQPSDSDQIGEELMLF